MTIGSRLIVVVSVREKGKNGSADANLGAWLPTNGHILMLM